ncbi:MAG: MarR family transcriptional regulator [Brachybacterium sp.]|nr:MarR family transcriptional regulator [Brachybacterium sp.]
MAGPTQIPTPSAPDASGYWYGSDQETVDPVELLNLLRRYRESEGRMRSRVRGDMRMGEKDLRALRMLMRARARGEHVRQRDLAQMLEITPASTSALVDRLVRDGYAERREHPQDRRSVAVVATDHGDHEVRATLDEMHRKMLAAAQSLTPAQREGAALFLRAIDEALA